MNLKLTKSKTTVALKILDSCGLSREKYSQLRFNQFYQAIQSYFLDQSIESELYLSLIWKEYNLYKAGRKSGYVAESLEWKKRMFSLSLLCSLQQVI